MFSWGRRACTQIDRLARALGAAAAAVAAAAAAEAAVCSNLERIHSLLVPQRGRCGTGQGWPRRQLHQARKQCFILSKCSLIHSWDTCIIRHAGPDAGPCWSHAAMLQQIDTSSALPAGAACAVGRTRASRTSAADASINFHLVTIPAAIQQHSTLNRLTPAAEWRRRRRRRRRIRVPRTDHRSGPAQWMPWAINALIFSSICMPPPGRARGRSFSGRTAALT